MGRPTDYDQKLDIVAFNHMRDGGTVESLAALLGKSRTTIAEWRRKQESFADAFNRGKDEHDTDTVEVALRKRALGCKVTKEKALVVDGSVEIVKVVEELPPSEAALRYWLNNRRAKRWKDKQEIEHSGDLGALIMATQDRKKGEARHDDAD